MVSVLKQILIFLQKGKFQSIQPPAPVTQAGSKNDSKKKVLPKLEKLNNLPNKNQGKPSKITEKELNSTEKQSIIPVSVVLSSNLVRPDTSSGNINKSIKESPIRLLDRDLLKTRNNIPANPNNSQIYNSSAVNSNNLNKKIGNQVITKSS